MVKQNDENWLLYYRTLFSPYLVEMYAKIKTERLNYIKYYQAYLRADSDVHLKDVIGRQEILLNLVIGWYSFHRLLDHLGIYMKGLKMHYDRPDLIITIPQEDPILHKNYQDQYDPWT